MPSYTERQRRFMGADYARAKKGKRTRTGMSRAKLREWARGGIRKRKGAKRRRRRR